MSAQDEIKQRLEVAQLYEEMGQLPKATRYYVAAAEMALKGKLYDQGRQLLNKVLELEPGNPQATTYLQKLDAHLASLGHAPPAARTAPGTPPANAASGGGLTNPTPALYLRSEQIAAILAQVSSAPNQKFFPYTPLPKIDMNAIAEKNKKLEAAREAERAKDRTAVESAFSNSGGGFTSGGSGFLNQAQRGGGRRREREKEEAQAAAPEASDENRRRRRGANQDLADSIRRRLQGG